MNAGAASEGSAAPTGSGALASTLEPALRDATGGRLGPVQWFSTMRQRGGAATGTAEWSLPSGVALPVVVKLPLGPVEYTWTSGLGTVAPDELLDSAESLDRCVPRVLASGANLGEYDLGWVVLERLAGDPLPGELSKQDLLDLIDTLADFQAAAAAHKPPAHRPPSKDFSEMLHRSREALPGLSIPEAQRWNEALKHAQRIISDACRSWSLREVNSWCHGDVHPGNALRRSSGGGSRLVLLDLALVHAGHWIEDAVYLERQFWGRKAALQGVKPVAALKRARAARGLPCGEGYQELADIRRLLMACCVPAVYTTEGSAVYAHAALELLERLTHMIAKRSA
ncbi:MAG: phosphotransferase [Planctomycetota bacterium]